MIRAAGATDVGRHREANEDRFHVDLARGIFMVVDGIGGHAAGDVAADTAVAAIVSRLARQTGPVTDRVREAITIANNEIHRLAASRPEWHGMACVLTVAVLDGPRVVIGHVGDSRLYRIRGQQIDKMTPDHSPVGAREDARELSEREAMHHPRRNEVFRDVGSEPHEVTDPDFAYLTTIDLPPDAAILICSDGLTDLVPAETIRQVAVGRAGSPERVVQGLIEAANAAGGKDNVTAVFIEGEAFGAANHVNASAAVSGPGRRWQPIALVVAALAVGAASGIAVDHQWGADLWHGAAAPSLVAPSAGAIVVRANESIAAAIESAQPGMEVIVEPGEYRERLSLKDQVRVQSRVPRAAVLRLPASAAATDAAVTATNVEHGELNGFRIIGDSATPLGTGIVVQHGRVRLTDIEISGAAVAALDLDGGDEVLVTGLDVHDNPGAGVVVRTGATPRITHSWFARNGLSPRTPVSMLIEAGALPLWWRNVFDGIGPELVGAGDVTTRAGIVRDNWFVGTGSAGSAPNAPSRGARARGAQGAR